MIDRNNVDEVRKMLKLFQKCLKVKYDSICKKLDDERIKEFIRQRCENYTDAKGKMITSFLDKYTASIVIDRVLLNSNQIGKETLVTDPTQIKQHTIRHFQECTGVNQHQKLSLHNGNNNMNQNRIFVTTFMII